MGGLRIGLGGFTAQTTPTGPRAGLGQRDLLDHAVLAEELGFDSFWVGEHHFSTDGYLAAIFPLLGAIAARTERIVLGTRVLLAPLRPALLLAEDAAQVALLAEGRFILGLGAGYRDDEFDALGVPRSQRGARLAEAVEVCRKAWLGEPFDHDGPSVRGSGLVCRPAPPTPPRIWLGGRAPAALARAARLADGFVAGLAGPRESAAVIAELDAVMPRGQPALPICTGAFVAVGSDGVMLDRLAAGIVHAVTQYRSWLTVEPELYSTATDETFGVVRGRPHEVIEQLLPRVIAHAGREHHLALRVDYPGLSKDQIADHIRLVASEIAPALRRAEASAAAG